MAETVDIPEDEAPQRRTFREAVATHTTFAGFPLGVIVSVALTVIPAILGGTWQVAVLHEQVGRQAIELEIIKHELVERHANYEANEKLQNSTINSIDNNMAVIGARLDYLIKNQDARK